MALINNLPIQELLLQGLESRVKQALKQEIVDKHVAEFKAEFESLVDSKLDGLVIESIEHFRQMADKSEHYAIKAYLNGAPISRE